MAMSMFNRPMETGQRQFVRLLAAAHTLNGYAYRICSASSGATELAAVSALNQMKIKVDSVRKEGRRNVIEASMGERDVEITLETLSPSRTRMRAVVRQGPVYDSTTATEIIVQTEKNLELPDKESPNGTAKPKAIAGSERSLCRHLSGNGGSGYRGFEKRA